MLEKTSRVKIDKTNGRVTKSGQNRDRIQVEKITLMLLESLHQQSTLLSTFLVPSVNEGKSSELSISMTYIAGMRLNEFIGTLNHIIEIHPSSQVVDKALRLKYYLLTECMNNISSFQHPSTQHAIGAILNPYTVNYNYNGKFREAMDYILQCCGNDEHQSTQLIDEIAEICYKLESAPAVYFRDSVFKNQIIEGIEIVNLDTYSPPFFKIGSWDNEFSKFCDSVISLNLNVLNIYNFDFDQAAELVAYADDWNQILTTEVLGLSHETGMELAGKKAGISPEDYNYSIIFRSLRAWARRLYYRTSRSDYWSLRYGFESLEYHYYMTLEAVESLRRNSLRRDAYTNLHGMLKKYKPLSRPWPWHIHPTDRWMI